MLRLISNLKFSPRLIFLSLFIGAGVLVGLFKFIPDGKLHLVFCDVGQGDAIYIRMPNQAEVLIDGGPNDRVLSCLGRYMSPFDRTLDVVIMTHPQKDHMTGLIGVIERYRVRYFVTVPVKDPTETYARLVSLLKEKQIPLKFPASGDKLQFDQVLLKTIWPEKKWLTEKLNFTNEEERKLAQNQMFGLATKEDLNLFSGYYLLNYIDFNVLFTGDGDQSIQKEILRLGLEKLLPQNINIFKVPHHGSKTAVSSEFLDLIKPKMSVIEVGKNSYGHPNKDTLVKLAEWGRVLRTDINNNIEFVSDGKNTIQK